jgi:GNAT superfamily N-acetyltransferase
MIRPARPQDAEPMQALTVRAWLRNWADFIEPSVMLAAAERDGTEPYLRSIGDPERDVLVFELDGAIAGHLLVAGAEIRAFYVDPPAQGAGVGTALLAAAEESIRAAGHDAGELHVFADNGLGRRFYEGRGWTLDSEPVLEEGDWAPSVRYVKAL